MCVCVCVCVYVLVKPHHERISLILHEAEAKLRPSVIIKDILRKQVRFNCLLSHKGIMLLMLPMTCKVAFDIRQHFMV